MPPVSPRRRRQLWLALASPVLALVLLELGLRVLGFGGPPDRVPDPLIRNQAYSPNQVLTMVHGEERLARASINAAGFRGQWALDPSRPGVLRILCLGDSWTFGWSVEDEQTYPRQLARRLERTGIEAEVLNGGMPGYNTENELLLYRHRLRALAPDVLILGVVTNDLEPTMPPVEVVGGRLGVLARRSALVGGWRALTGSHGFLLRRLSSPDHQRRLAVLTAHRAEILASPGQGEGPGFVEPWRSHFEALLGEARADGVRVLVLGFPARFQVRRGRTLLARGEDPGPRLERLTGWQLLLEALAQREGMPYLDLLLPLVEVPEDPFGAIDRGHPGPVGYEVIAEQVAQELVRLGWAG